MGNHQNFPFFVPSCNSSVRCSNYRKAIMRLIEAAYPGTDGIPLTQAQQLQQLVGYLKEHSPFYRELFAQHAIDPDGIKTAEDLSILPTTSKEDLQRRNGDFLCVPREKIIEYASTSGTLASPVPIALTENDLNRLAYNEYNSFKCADGAPDDIYQLMLTLDRQFMAGIAYYSSLRKLGAGIIRLGPGVPSLQWQTFRGVNRPPTSPIPLFIFKHFRLLKDTRAVYRI